MSNRFQGNLPPVGAPPGFVPGQSPMPPAPPIPGMLPQTGGQTPPDQLQAEMELIQLLMQNPQFAQAVTALRARRMQAAQGAPGAAPPIPGAAGPAPSGAPVPGGFADFVNKGR